MKRNTQLVFNEETVKGMLPKKLRSMVTEDFVNKVNSISDDVELLDSIRENFISFSNILNTGKYKLEDYFNAVRYVTYKLLEKNDFQAWISTFPERYDRLRKQGKSDDDIRPHASMYKKNKLVNLIFEQTVIPDYVINAPLRQKAINEMYKLMMDDNQKGLVRVKAAEAVINATKAPENVEAKISLDINPDSLDAVSSLKRATEELARMQLEALKSGASLSSISNSRIVTDDVIDVEVEDNKDE